MSLLFVYGTLRKDMVNHYLVKDCSIVQTNYCLHGFEMRSNTTDEYPFPYAFVNENESIVGDIIDVPESLLNSAIDDLEGVTKKHYIRYWDSKNSLYIYVKAIDNRNEYPLVPSGNWVNYASENNLITNPAY